MNDSIIAEIARRLAEALSDCSYTRNDVDKKRVAVLNTELCSAVRRERDEPAQNS